MHSIITVSSLSKKSGTRLNVQDIQTAKLPIEAYIKLASSKVLTVNHVVEILLAWLECRDWKEAFFKVIPTRKRAAEDASAADEQSAEQTRDQSADQSAEQAHGQQDDTTQASVPAEPEVPGASIVDGAACCEQPSHLLLDSPMLSQDVVEPSEKRTKLE